MTTQKSFHTDYDLVIVGGGSAGFSLILGLTPYFLSGYIKKVLLIEKETEPTYFPGRSIAINQHTIRYFSNINIPFHNTTINCLEYLAPLIEPIKTIITTTDFHEQCLVSRCHQHSNDQFGGSVDLVDFQLKLRDLVETLKSTLESTHSDVQIDILLGTQVSACELSFNDQQTYRKLTLVNTTDQQTIEITADLVAIANGAKFISGLTTPPKYTQTIAHKQVGIIADVIYNQDVPCVATEYFTKHGPIAFLPKDKNTATIAYCYNHAPTVEKCLESKQFFADELNKALANIPKLSEILKASIKERGSYEQLAKPTVHSNCIYHGEMFDVNVLVPEKVQVKAVSETKGYLLNATLIKKLNEPNVVYVGNAAHTLHPVSGQGFNLGVLGLENLLQAISQTQAKHPEQTFNQLVNVIGQQYNLLHCPVAQEVYNRTNTLAREFTLDATTNNWTRAFGLYHLIAYPLLQDIVVNPSIGNVRPGEFKYIYKLLPVKSLN